MGEPREQGHMDTTPHVSNARWYGHDRPDDQRYHMDHGFPHGRCERFGPGYRYNIVRIDHDHHRFWLPGGFFFDVAAWDWPICADWCWDRGDDYVIYEDPDHIGWYLLYNAQTGAYVHVTARHVTDHPAKQQPGTKKKPHSPIESGASDF
jgi:hypothetical protein